MEINCPTTPFQFVRDERDTRRRLLQITVGIVASGRRCFYGLTSTGKKRQGIISVISVISGDEKENIQAKSQASRLFFSLSALRHHERSQS